MPTMNEKMLELVERRNRLLARITAQREDLAEIGLHLQSPLSLVDKGVAVARFLRFHPADSSTKRGWFGVDRVECVESYQGCRFNFG